MIDKNFKEIFHILEEEFENNYMPLDDLIEVKENDKFRILIATILSARTKDQVTSIVCRRLFNKVKNFKDLSRLDVSEIEKLIYPVGFYKTKAKHLKELPKIILKEFNGEIPDNMDKLLKLPGVGRKTANLVLATAFDKDAICVDTHVHRISNRLGWVKTKNPGETEIVLMEVLPKEYWKDVNYTLVAHGQRVCSPINPYCSRCKIKKYCKQVGVLRSR